MRRFIAVASAAALLLTALDVAVPATGAEGDVKACFVWNYDEGCTTRMSVAIGWYAKLRAKAPWHAGGRVDLYQRDPGETSYHRVAELTFNDKGRATWRWDAPSEVECCWYWKFKARDGDGTVIAVSNRLQADAAPGD